MGSKGFGSLSKDRRKEIARRGGKKSAEVYKRTGKGHAWTPQEAKENGTKAAAVIKHKRVLQAALVLLRAGYTAQEIMNAKLSDDEYIRLAVAVGKGDKHAVENRLRVYESQPSQPISISSTKAGEAPANDLD